MQFRSKGKNFLSFNYQKIKYTLLRDSKIFKKHIFSGYKYSTFKKILLFDLKLSFYLNSQLASLYLSYFFFKITELKSILYINEILMFQEESLFARYFIEIFFSTNHKKFELIKNKTLLASDFRHLFINKTKKVIWSEFIENSIFNIKLNFSKKKSFSLKKNFFLSLYLYLDLSVIKVKNKNFQYYYQF